MADNSLHQYSGMLNGTSSQGSSVPSLVSPNPPSNHSSVPPSIGSIFSATERDWETSPMYVALSARLAQQETSLSTLSAQVSQLTLLVKAALPPQASQQALPVQTPVNHQLTSGIISPGKRPDQQVFSPFETPNTAIPQQTPPSQDASLSALTQQISALSTSVAQLQRLQQQNQAQTSRTNSFSNRPSRSNERFPNNIPASLGRLHHPQPRDLQTGPMTGPAAPYINPSTGFNPTPRRASQVLSGTGATGAVGNRDFSPPVRPNISQTMSTSVLPGIDGDKWGPPSFNHNTGRDWSPGPGHNGHQGGNGYFATNHGPTTPGVFGSNGASTPGGTFPGPGAGIVVSKWDQLGLKPELLRSIMQYGIGPPNKIQARVLPFMLKGSDVIAQAPPTQERIISYVIPALQLCTTLSPPASYRGPTAVIITTTVDQATQCHKLVRSIGGPLGVRSALATGVAGLSSLPNEIATMQRDAIHLLVGTPAKVNDVFTSRGALDGSEVRLLVLDEVDQLIARNLYENVLSVVKVLPSPRRAAAPTPGGAPVFSPGAALGAASPYDPGQNSPFNPASKTPFPTQNGKGPSRFGAPGSNPAPAPASANTIERQTCIFSNTIPTDVINFSQSLQVRDPVRVLVRREGGPNSQESVSSVTPGINLKHTYVYLTITGSARPDTGAQTDGPGAIGSGRAAAANGQMSEEATKAKEYKLDTLVKMLEDYPLWQAVIHVGTLSMLEAVVFKLNSRQWETLFLAPDMPPSAKKTVLQKWRLSLAGTGPRFLVVFDVAIKPPEIPWSPLVINFDLPRSVEGYAQRAAAAVPPSNTNRGESVFGVIVSFVQAAGGDVEMLRSTECAYRFKSAEIPSVFHDLFQH